MIVCAGLYVCLCLFVGLSVGFVVERTPLSKIPSKIPSLKYPLLLLYRTAARVIVCWTVKRRKREENKSRHKRKYHNQN